MGACGAHKVYVLFGEPLEQGREELQAADLRMNRVVAVAAQAHANAIAHVPPGTSPTWQRGAFEVVQLQRFNSDPKKAVVPAPIKLENLKNGWKVFDTWSGLQDEGTDCVSGAVFSFLVIAGAGWPGYVEPVVLTLKSAAEWSKAVSFTAPIVRVENINDKPVKQTLCSLRLAVPELFRRCNRLHTRRGVMTFYFPVLSPVVGGPRFKSSRSCSRY